VSYLSVSDIQSWLQQSKYPISSVDAGLEAAAISYVFGEIGQRYDTSSWVSAATTPSIIKIILAMQVAAYELRKAAGEEDGRTTYADALEARLGKMCDAIVSGAIVLNGVPFSDTGTLGLGPAFFPADGDNLRETTDPDYAPAYFSMSHEF
jgi:hypothetical protein